MTKSADPLALQLRRAEAEVADLQRSLQRAREREGRLLDGLPDMLFWTNGRGEVLDFRVPDDHLLVPRDQVLGWRVTEPPMPAVAGQGVLQAIGRCLSTGEPQSFRYELSLPAGVRQQEARVVCLSEDRTLILVRDLTTDQRRATRSHDAMADEHERILTSLEGYVWSAVIDGQGTFRYRYYSPVVAALTGRPPEFYLVGPERFRSTVHPEDLPEFERALAQLTSRERAAIEAVYRIRMPDGRARWMRDRVRAEDVAGELFLTGVVSDVTEARRVEERLRETQRLEELGSLAGGVAHDFNNLLVGMLGGAEILAEQLGESHPGRASLDLIRDSALRAAELCQQMLDYAGHAGMVVEVVDLADITRSMGPLLLASVDKQVRLEVSVPEAPLHVRADPTQLRRIVLNLVKNASEAVPEVGGLVRVSLSARSLSRGDLASAVAGQDAPPGRYVVLRVDDDGAGMDGEVRRRMFEPFFSTKERGHGLGLSAALGIVRAHQGALHVTSAPGAGASIEVALPQTDAPAPSERPAGSGAESRAARQPGEGVVLVIDDEPTVLAIAHSILAAEGYEVLTADSGAAGLARLEARASGVDAVVLDMTMPGMSGAEVYRALRERDPSLPIVVCSGYSEEDALGSLAQQYEVAFLSKPYRATALREAVASALTTARRDPP